MHEDNPIDPGEVLHNLDGETIEEGRDPRSLADSHLAGKKSLRAGPTWDVYYAVRGHLAVVEVDFFATTTG